MSIDLILENKYLLNVTIYFSFLTLDYKYYVLSLLKFNQNVKTYLQDCSYLIFF